MSSQPSLGQWIRYANQKYSTQSFPRWLGICGPSKRRISSRACTLPGRVAIERGADDLPVASFSTTPMETVRKLPLVVALGACLAVGAANARAILYVDIDVVAKPLTPSQQTRQGDFNLLSLGFNPATQKITAATVWFTFADDKDLVKAGPIWVPDLLDTVKEQVQIDLGTTPSPELGPVEVDIVSIVSSGLAGSLLLDLSSDGVLKYEVRQTKGDFLFVGAKLIANGEFTAVPDSGITILLMALGVLSLLGAYRSLRS